MEFRILGPLEVRQAGQLVPVTATKQRALLAIGLAQANRVVSVSRLIDAIWGDAPPASASGLIHTYVSALRRMLQACGGGDVIATRPPGYLVQVRPDQLDLLQFEDFLAEGRAAAAAGGHTAAATAMRAALACWRGPALDGVDSPVVRAEAARLDELRFVALEECITAELAGGDARSLVAELVGAVAAEPQRERLRCQLMLALYRSGRQQDALDVYRQGRKVLRDEFGLDPGPELQTLHRRILNSDDELRQPQSTRVEPIGVTVRRPSFAAVKVAGSGAIPASPPSVFGLAPAQVPAAPKILTGRDDDVRILRMALSAPARSALMCAVTGKAGSGKTALVLAVAQAVRGEYPDGQLFASLHGVDRSTAVHPREVLGAFLRSLGMNGAALPEAEEERSAMFRSLLAGRQVLVVLDDAGSESQVRPLLPATAGCAVLLNSRNLLTGLDGDVHLRLDVLDTEPAVQLLGQIVGDDRVRAEPQAAAEIVRFCGGLPLAVRTAGARLAARREWPLSVLASRLRDEHRRLDELAAGDLEVRASVELSCRGLTEIDRLAFRRLGVLGLPDFAPWLLAPLVDVSLADAEGIADRLADANLIDLAGVGLDGHVRYRVHDLIRLFARERGNAEESVAVHEATLERVLRWLVGLAATMAERGPSVGARHNQSGDHRRHIPPALIEALQRQPLAWFEAERRSLVVAVERAGELGLHRLASELSVSLMSSFRLFNSFDEWGRTHAAALAAARLAGDRRAEATILLGLGHLRYEQDRFSDADEYYRDALSASREVGERHNEASALIGLAAIRRDHGHFAEALHFLSQATVICRALDDLVGTADAAYGIGYVHCETGDLAQAQASLEIALDAYRASGDRRGEGLTLRSIGLVHRARGDLAYASEFSAQAIDAFLEVGDALLEAYGVQALAKVHIRQGRVAGVQMRLSRCLDVCRQLGDRFGAALMLRTLGELHLALNELDTAVEYLDEAIAAWERLDLGLFRARTQRDLAVAYERRGDTAAAHAVRSAAVATFREFGSRECNELTFGVHREHSGPVPTKPRDRWLVADGARLQQPD